MAQVMTSGVRSMLPSDSLQFAAQAVDELNVARGSKWAEPHPSGNFGAAEGMVGGLAVMQQRH